MTQEIHYLQMRWSDEECWHTLGPVSRGAPSSQERARILDHWRAQWLRDAPVLRAGAPDLNCAFRIVPEHVVDQRRH